MRSTSLSRFRAHPVGPHRPDQCISTGPGAMALSRIFCHQPVFFIGLAAANSGEINPHKS
jgi:hypothetical protein